MPFILTASLLSVATRSIEIDRGFVSKLVTSAQDAAIVRALLTMGRDMGLEVIAEGVEPKRRRRSCGRGAV